MGMKSGPLKNRIRNQFAKAFTLIELLVVIAIIALLLSVLLPSLRKAKEQTKKVVCSSNLGQVAKALEMYSMEYDYKRITLRTPSTGQTYWMGRLAPYFGDDQYITDTSNRRIIKALLCPSAPASRFDPQVQKSVSTGTSGSATRPWEWNKSGADNSTLGSYALNGWVGYDYLYDNRDDMKDLFFKDWLNIPGNTPIFGDCMWVVAWPRGTDTPPPDLSSGELGAGHMNLVAMDRHNRTVNLISRDLSVQNLQLEALWYQRWHVDYQFPEEEIVIPGR